MAEPFTSQGSIDAPGLPSPHPEGLPVRLASNGAASVRTRRPIVEPFTDETLERMAALARDFLAAERDEPVAPHLPPEDLAASLDLALGPAGLPADQVFDLVARVMALTPRTCTAAFFNQLYAGRDAVPTAAEMLTALMNTSMYTYRVAGPHALIEHELVRHMASKVGYAEGEGIICPGGSIANLCAMIIARNEARPGIQDDGHDGRPMVAYASEESHYSLNKAAAMTGIGRRNLRAIAADARGRMIPDALRSAIAADRERGAEPFMIIATAGTTVLGAFDPIDDLASIAEESGLWLHVDGALGGSFLVSERLRPLLRGSDRSNSFNWNPHKLMGVPLSCSPLLTREQGLLKKHFKEPADYLFQSDPERFDHGTMSIQCGRRNDALKIWAAWKRHGDAGYARRVERLCDLVQYAADRVRRDPQLILTAEPESVCLCFEVVNRQSQKVCERLLLEQRAMVGHAVVRGRKVIRLACANPEVTEADLDRFFDHIRAIA